MENKFWVHESSYIGTKAVIGEGTKIWQFCNILNDSEIGKNCLIGQNVFIENGVKIGNNVKIKNNISLYSGVECEDDVFLGPSCVFTNVLNPRSFIERKHEFRKTLIKRGATIGANVTIVCGNTVGEYALIGAGSVITKDVPAYALMIGNPAKLKGYVCQCGEKLQKEENIFSCKRCGEKYMFNEEKLIKISNNKKFGGGTESN
ncbi:N-acetyltransferase (plasmid) [Fusobacterium sp. SB021]|uniref:acyltransferase n=1 Tax=Fusobacterium sp. SB021 TaxID=2744227 RepID=UPI003CF54F54